MATSSVAKWLKLSKDGHGRIDVEYICVQSPFQQSTISQKSMSGDVVGDSGNKLKKGSKYLNQSHGDLHSDSPIMKCSLRLTDPS